MRVKVSLKEYNEWRASVENEKPPPGGTSTNSLERGEGEVNEGAVAAQQDSNADKEISVVADVGAAGGSGGGGDIDAHSIRSDSISPLFEGALNSRHSSIDDIIASLGLEDGEKSTYDLLMGDVNDVFSEFENGTVTSGDNRINKVSTASESGTSTSTSSKKKKRKSKKKKGGKSRKPKDPFRMFLKAAHKLKPSLVIPILSSQFPSTAAPSVSINTDTSNAADKTANLPKVPTQEVTSSASNENQNNDDETNTTQNAPPCAEIKSIDADKNVEVELDNSKGSTISDEQTVPTTPVANGSHQGSLPSSSETSPLSLYTDESPLRSDSRSAPELTTTRFLLYPEESLFPHSSEHDQENKPKSFVPPAPFVIESLTPLYKDFELNKVRAIVQRGKPLPSFHTLKKRRLPKSVFLQVEDATNGTKRYKVEGEDEEAPSSLTMRTTVHFPSVGTSMPQNQQQSHLQRTVVQEQSQLAPISVSSSPISTSLNRETGSSQREVIEPVSQPLNLPASPSKSSLNGSKESTSSPQQKTPTPAVAATIAAPKWKLPQQARSLSILQQQATRPAQNCNDVTTQNLKNNEFNNKQPADNVQVPVSSSPSDFAVFKAPLPVKGAGRPTVNTPKQATTQTQQSTQQKLSLIQSFKESLEKQWHPPMRQQQWQRPPTFSQQQLQSSTFTAGSISQHQQQFLAKNAYHQQYPQYATPQNQQMTPQQQQYFQNSQPQPRNPFYLRSEYSQNATQQSQQFRSLTRLQSPSTSSYSLNPTGFQPVNWYANSRRQIQQYQGTQIQGAGAHGHQSAAPFPQQQQSVSSAYNLPPTFYPGASNYFGNKREGNEYPNSGGTLAAYSQPSVRVPASPSAYLQQQQMLQQPYQMQNPSYSDPFSSKGTRVAGASGASYSSYAQSQGYPRGGTSNFGSQSECYTGGTNDQRSSNPINQHQQKLNYHRQGGGIQIQQQQQQPSYTLLQRQSQQSGGNESPRTSSSGSSFNEFQQYLGTNSNTRAESQLGGGLQKGVPHQKQSRTYHEGTTTVAAMDQYRADPFLLPQKAATPSQQYNFPRKPGGEGPNHNAFSSQDKQSTATQPILLENQQKVSAASASNATASKAPCTSEARSITSSNTETSPGNKASIISRQSFYSAYKLEKSRRNNSKAPTPVSKTLRPVSSIPPEIISGGETVLFRPKSVGSQPYTEGFRGAAGRGPDQNAGGASEGSIQCGFTIPWTNHPKPSSARQGQPSPRNQLIGWHQNYTQQQKSNSECKLSQPQYSQYNIGPFSQPQYQTLRGNGEEQGITRSGLHGQDSSGKVEGEQRRKLQIIGVHAGGNGRGEASTERRHDPIRYFGGQPQSLQNSKDESDNSSVRIRKSTPWDSAGSRDHNGGKTSLTQKPAAQIQAAEHQETNQREKEEEEQAKKRMPHHGRDLSVYTQLETSGQNQRMPEDSSTLTNSQSRSNSTILSRYLQGTEWKLRCSDERANNKHKKDTPTHTQEPGRRPWPTGSVQTTSVQSSNPDPKEFTVTTAHSKDASENSRTTYHHLTSASTITSKTSHDRRIYSVSTTPTMVQAPTDTKKIHGHPSPDWHQSHAYQNGLSPLSGTAASSSASSSPITPTNSPCIQAHGSHPGTGTNIQRYGQPNSNRISEPHERSSSSEGWKQTGAFQWYFP